MGISLIQEDDNLFLKKCETLQDSNYLNFIVSILILLGILISYFPQHYRIIARRTSEGISPYFIVLGVTSGTCALANVLTLPASRTEIACCKVISTFECTSGLLGIAQVAAQWACFSLNLILFLIFFPRATIYSNLSESMIYTWRTALTVTLTCISHGLIVAMISIIFAVIRPSYLNGWANLLGIAATALTLTQYLPQITMTWKLGHVGSLSIPMMLIQTPGSLVWAASLASRLGINGWSTWGIFLVTGFLQGSLLVMGIYFELTRRNTIRHDRGILQRGTPESDDEGGPVGQDPLGSDETSPLLHSKPKLSTSVRK
ncbi:BgTH12-00231 [Blumeria graminis f. sp. triticale]|uniref:BgTH12-00231 n=1 Tax=Blumeria graminis f. sp. triticale TaxID=1689686 RepID=A0A9W4GH65_BLUGR|nr:BgTH12-00231 [Blumeria graminis f. sp. triticale]